jgi:hypothetical protein
MATQRDVRKIALALPETSEDPDGFRFFVKGKQFVWVWLERVEPKKARVPNPDVIAVRVADDLDKQVLLASDRTAFFTEAHYDGYPAVLVRLSKIDRERLKEVVTNAWRCRASSGRR